MDYITSSKSAEFINRIVGNRSINEPRVKTMTRDILDGNAKFMPPIMVDKSSSILMDGQHRLEAFKRAWAQGCNQPLGVVYIDCPREEIMPTIISLQKGKAWTNRDYFNSLLDRGDENAVRLNEFAKSRRLLTKKSGALSVRNTGYIVFGRNIDGEIKRGALTVTAEDIAKAAPIYDEVEKIIHRLGFPINNWTSGMIQGWRNVRLDEEYGPKIDEIGFNVFLKFFKDKAYFSKKSAMGYGYKDWEEKFARCVDRLYKECFS